MQIGWCAPLAKAPMLKELGYDYIEVPLAAFGLEDAASVRTAARALADCPLPTPAFGYFLPPDMQIVGSGVDTARVRNYLAHAAELSKLDGLLVHMHTADTHRLSPGTGRYDYGAFLNALRTGGYAGRLSVECMVSIPEREMLRSLTFLRQRCVEARL